MSKHYQFFVSCPKGIEDLLCNELEGLELSGIETSIAGVSFSGDLSDAYKVCLWSRLASRVFMQLAEFKVVTDDQLYEQVSTIQWSQHLSENGSLAISCHLSNSTLTNSHYLSLKTKDAIVDQFSEIFGQRPSVDRDQPDVRINLHINNDHATLSLDLSGQPLHKRGYRVANIAAPMKENLAAAILLRAGWPNENHTLVDLMCGSATLLIEAAYMALNIAPGLGKDYFGFINWKGHDKQSWDDLLADAEEKKARAMKQGQLTIKGYDRALTSIKAARNNVHAAGMDKFIQIEKRAIEDCDDPGIEQPGLVVVNPPYGERLGDVQELAFLYADLGDCWKRHFGDWSTALFTGNLELAKHIGLRSHKDNTLYNGPIKCKLFHYHIRPLKNKLSNEQRAAKDDESKAIIANRLKKNFKHLARWAKKNDIQCYRVYDADIPEYSAAIDIYQDWVLVQEYQAPQTIDVRKVRQRLDHIMSVIPEVLNVDEKHVILKTRRQQKGTDQYQKEDDSRDCIVVQEAGLNFSINLRDYLDTGLFLDHRTTRSMIRDWSKNKRVLNLFAYTGSVSVYAAAGAAASVTTIDMSRTYLDWAKRNFRLNKFNSDDFEFIQADCVKWLDEHKDDAEKYDLIFLDPPTFSNSKRMDDVFDIQKDHVSLISTTMKLLDSSGILVFSNNFRKFKMDAQLIDGFDIQDISKTTIPEDFKRNQKIHHCWTIKHKQ